MNLADVQERLSALDPASGADLIYELLAAYGIAQTSITRLRTGEYNKSGAENPVLWRAKVWDSYLPEADEVQLLAALDEAQTSKEISKHKPRFYIARNGQHLAAVDNITGQTLDTPLTDLERHAAFFMPWTGAERDRSGAPVYIDTRVAKQMAKLYDEIISSNPDLPDADRISTNTLTQPSRQRRRVSDYLAMAPT